MVSTTTTVLLLFIVALANEAIANPPKVLVISFDSFLDKYMNPDVVPDLVNFRDSNASALYMKSVFPATTFVNYFSIATGLYAEQHGVLGDIMFDDKNNQMYGVPEQYKYDPRVVPIWIQNETEGEKRYSGTMWPGSCFLYQNRRPTYCQKININTPWEERVHTFMEWLTNPEKPANLVMVYFEKPDNVGHKYGTESNEMLEEIKRVQEILMHIIQEIKKADLEKELNLIVLSAHGMRDVTFPNIINFDNYVDEETYKNMQLKYKTVITSCYGFVHAEPDNIEEVYTYFKHIADNSQRFMVYKKNELKDEWKIKGSNRLNGKLFLLAKPGYAFRTTEVNEILKTTEESEFCFGVHGYDNAEPSMRAMFMASGPKFKKNTKTDLGVSLIEVYSLLKHLLGLKSAASVVQSNRLLVNMIQLLSKYDDADKVEIESTDDAKNTESESTDDDDENTKTPCCSFKIRRMLKARHKKSGNQQSDP